MNCCRSTTHTVCSREHLIIIAFVDLLPPWLISNVYPERCITCYFTMSDPCAAVEADDTADHVVDKETGMFTCQKDGYLFPSNAEETQAFCRIDMTTNKAIWTISDTGTTSVTNTGDFECSSEFRKVFEFVVAGSTSVVHKLVARSAVYVNFYFGCVS